VVAAAIEVYGALCENRQVRAGVEGRVDRGERRSRGTAPLRARSRIPNQVPPRNRAGTWVNPSASFDLEDWTAGPPAVIRELNRWIAVSDVLTMREIAGDALEQVHFRTCLPPLGAPSGSTQPSSYGPSDG